MLQDDSSDDEDVAEWAAAADEDVAEWAAAAQPAASQENNAAAKPRPLAAGGGWRHVHFALRAFRGMVASAAAPEVCLEQSRCARRPYQSPSPTPARAALLPRLLGRKSIGLTH
jgi:hypothetical protein